jgi:hypothetical protein
MFDRKDRRLLSSSLPKFNPQRQIAARTGAPAPCYSHKAPKKRSGGTPMLKSIREWQQKRTLRTMLNDSRAARGYRSTVQLEKSIAADRSTTERLLMAIGARKATDAEEWTLKPQRSA